MDTDPSVFDSKAAKWKERQDQPWLRLRYSLVHENLCAHLRAGPHSILDVGGGDGLDSVPLAKAGHNVALLVFSEKMLEIARENARKEQVEGNGCSLLPMAPLPLIALVIHLLRRRHRGRRLSSSLPEHCAISTTD